MDALLLLQPTATAVGYDGPGDFFLDQLGRHPAAPALGVAPFVYAGIQILHPRLFDDAPEGRLLDSISSTTARSRQAGCTACAMTASGSTSRRRSSWPKSSAHRPRHRTLHLNQAREARPQPCPTHRRHPRHQARCSRSRRASASSTRWRRHCWPRRQPIRWRWRATPSCCRPGAPAVACTRRSCARATAGRCCCRA